MFTGIIEEIGVIRSVKRSTLSASISIGAKRILDDLKNGDSVNTDGACLTVVSIDKEGFTLDAVAETMRRTNLHLLKIGSKVNLERAVRLNDRLGGHLVSGHIDGTGKIIGVEKEDNALWITISTESEILKFIISKGSIAIDGISLTVAKRSDVDFSVSLIPYTIKDTTLAGKKIGDMVNLECDLIGKYVEQFLTYSNQSRKGNISLDYLKEHGFL